MTEFMSFVDQLHHKDLNINPLTSFYRQNQNLPSLCSGKEQSASYNANAIRCCFGGHVSGRQCLAHTAVIGRSCTSCYTMCRLKGGLLGSQPQCIVQSHPDNAGRFLLPVEYAIIPGKPRYYLQNKYGPGFL